MIDPNNLPIGTPVVVTRDNGSLVFTQTRGSPWQDRDRWLVEVDGITGGYALERVRLREPDE